MSDGFIKSPYEVSCPHCGAPALAPCRFPRGTPVLPHRERLRLVAGPGRARQELREQQAYYGAERAILWRQMKHLARQE